MDINVQNKEKYLEDLKNWLCEIESAPLEEMGAFSASACRNTKHA